MLRNQLIIAWRNLVKRKGFSLINILGLSVGIAACLMIYLYVHYELTYDLYNEKADRIVRVTTDIKGPESVVSVATSPLKLGWTLQRENPEVESVARLRLNQVTIHSGADLFKESQWYETDAAVFSVFTFSFLEGRAEGSLDRPHTVVLTRSTAKKYFGKTRALGKIIICGGNPYTVTGVVEDRPSNSDLTIDALMSVDFSKTDWVDDDMDTYTFVLFRGKPDLGGFREKLRRLAAGEVQAAFDKADAGGYHFTFETERLEDVHFSQGKIADPPKGSRSLNLMFSLLSGFILLIALLNYINLSTAKATERAKEVGIRKVNGAVRIQLIRQFLFESLVLVGLSWLVAIGLIAAGLPLLNKLLQTHLSVSFAGIAWQAPLVFIGTVLLAGLYPAFILSSFQPSDVLKGCWKQGITGLFLRRTITLAQFTITAALITGTLVIYSQMRYIGHKDLGFDKDQLLTLTTPTDSVLQGSVAALIQALQEEPGIRGVTAGNSMQIGGVQSIANIKAGTGGKINDFLCDFFFIDTNFIPLMRINLMQGRNFSDSYGADKQGGFIVNQAFVDRMGWARPLGQSMEGFGHKGTVTGVVHNFYFKSLHKAAEPLVMIYNTAPTAIILIKTPSASLPRVRKLWKIYFPNVPIEYSFLDQNLAEQYRKDRTTMSLFNAFTVLAIFVSCLGLYGLVSLVTVQRTKEIGIRKVLGAPVRQLIFLLMKGFMSVVILASLIAIPLAAIATHRWLETYAYHIRLSWWMFGTPLVLIILIAVSATVYRVWRAALANPVRNLRAD